MEGCLSVLSNWVTDLEKHVEETNERISTTEDSHGTYGTSIAAIEKKIKQLQLKIDDLEIMANVKT